MVLLAVYLFFLFIFGLGTTVVTYHIMRYRDPDDISGIVLAVYYILVLAIVIGTAVMVDWQQLFSTSLGLL